MILNRARGRHRWKITPTERSQSRPKAIIGACHIGFSGALALGVALAVSAAPVSAQSQSTLQQWLAQDTATGDWGGARTQLSNDGVDLALNFTTDILGNVTGGIEQRAEFAGMWYGTATVDLGTLAGLTGLSFTVAGALTQGRDLSGDHIGNLFAVAQVFNGDTIRLAELYFEQSLFSDQLSIAIGRLAAGDDFATADAYGYYVNSAVNGNPTGILVNAPSFTTPPFVQWGVRGTVTTDNDLYFSAGLYNADPDVQDDDVNGLDFTLNPQDGVLMLAEAGWKPNSGDDATGLPGHYALGVWGDTSDYAFVNGADQSQNGNYGFYAIAQQMVYQEPGSSDEGLTIWGTVNVAPDEDINTLPVALFGGAYYEGLFPSRPNDVTAFGISYAGFSDTLPDQTYELALEVNHRFQLGNWLYLQPDLQYIANPNGGGIDNALVVGFEASVDF